MNLFRSFKLTWWQGGLFKLAFIALGIAIGATWPDMFAGWTLLFFIFFLAAVFYLTVIWAKQ